MRVLLVVVVIGCGDGRSAPLDAQMIDAAVDGPVDAAIDASIDAPTSTICSPLTQQPCSAGQKCAWIEDQHSPPLGHMGCVPDGVVLLGGACTVGAAGPGGYSNCVRGTECVAGTCKSICDHQGGSPMCDALHACSRYFGLFVSGDTTVAGVCDPKCDPLSQRLDTTQAEACGSPDPASPSAGCYTFGGEVYTCSPIAPSNLSLTDRMPAAGSSGAFVNGCAPGFLPFFRMATGSNVVVCAGMCAPLKTDTTLPQNAKGDVDVLAKLPLEPAPAAGNAVCVPGKKGSEANQNCLFMWPFNVEQGMLPPSPYNDGLGICFAPAHYAYDHDNSGVTPDRQVPLCENLPPRGPLANCTCDAQGNNCSGTACPDGQAHEWGCYSSTDSGFTTFTNGKAPMVKPALRDFRVGYGAGAGVRHRIVF